MLPVMAAVMVIIVPIQAFAEEENQWSEIRAWKNLKDDTIPVLIVRDSKVSEHQVDIVEDAINSKQTKNSSRTLFLGWNEGIKEISKSYGVKIPKLEIKHNLDSTESITIYLMEKTSKEGFNGYTDLFYDANGDIQKAFVKIYNTDELDNMQLESIIRHELGHALGLSHTNAKNDLMQPVINMNFNAISVLDLLALVSVY